MRKKIKLWELAHSRAGDKGDISNLSLIPYNEKDFDLLKREITVERLKYHFHGIVKGRIERYELPKIRALNFVMYGALGGGVTRNLCLDAHGKTLSFTLLNMEIDLDD